MGDKADAEPKARPGGAPAEADSSSSNSNAGSAPPKERSLEEIDREIDERLRVSKGAAASGAAVGMGVTLAGLGLGPGGLVVGAVVGVAAGGAMGLAAFGEGGRVNKFAQAAGRKSIEAVAGAKRLDDKYRISANLKKAGQDAHAFALKHEVPQKAQQAIGAVKQRLGKQKQEGGGGWEERKAGEAELAEAGEQGDEEAVAVAVAVSEEEAKGELAEQGTLNKSDFVLLEARVALKDQDRVVIHDLTKPEVLKAWMDEKVDILEGSKTQEAWTFRVLKPLRNVQYKRQTFKGGVRVSKETVKLGDFDPLDKPVSFVFEEVQVPKGALVRGTYKTNMELRCDSGTLLSRRAVARITKREPQAV